MKKFGQLFLLWVTLLSLFVSITGFIAKLDLLARIFQILFIPVTVYLLSGLIGKLINRTSTFDKDSGWKKIVIYYCFIITTILVVASFVSSDTLAELISSALFTPLPIYFLLMVIPRANLAAIQPSKESNVEIKQSTEVVPANIDTNRRDFLKLIGTAGILTFVVGLFSRRTAPFFAGVTDFGTASLKDSTGNKINPAEKSPTDGYYISQVDDSIPAYFGFINNQGQWYIMKEEVDGTFLYVRGIDHPDQNWAIRDTLSYDRFDRVF